MTATAFPQADCLVQLESLRITDTAVVDSSLPTWLALALSDKSANRGPSEIVRALIQLLTAKKRVWQAALDTGLIADELRRYQKFAKPGQPSAHIVQLRQKQAAARQASSIARQSFIKAAAAFVRETDIEVPPRVGLEIFITGWIDTHIPKAFTPMA